MTRQLTTIRTVSELLPIEGADRIEIAKVDGWQCVVKKGEFMAGDQGLFFEIDSVLPEADPRFAFMAKSKFRVKTMRLRKVLSQGLLLPMSTLTLSEILFSKDKTLDEVLGVKLYEPPANLNGCGHSGVRAGTFPTHLVPRTDQERIQNIRSVLNGRRPSEFEITEKLDGTSCTMWYFDEGYRYRDAETTEESDLSWPKTGVASRNFEIDTTVTGWYSDFFNSHAMAARLENFGKNIAIQGEIIGPGIQKNSYRLEVRDFYVFDVWDIDNRRYLSMKERLEVCEFFELKHVPLLSFFDDDVLSLDVVLAVATGTSRLVDTPREGVVFKSHDGLVRFKAISNEWLLTNE